MYFAISSIRGNYPQIFSSQDGNVRFLGGYDWLQHINLKDLKNEFGNE